MNKNVTFPTPSQFLVFGKWLMREQKMQWLKMTQHPQKK